MNAWEAALLGLIQGLTEFLPVSSSGHLTLVQRWLGWKPSSEQAIAFDVVVHLGTLVAVLLYFRVQLLEILLRRRKAIVTLALATAPLGLALFLRKLVAEVQEDPLFLGLAFFATAALLLAADPPGRAPPPPDAPQPGPDALEDVPPARALGVGFAQLGAILPGVSRSGSTISCGLLLGLSPRLAGELSFLMSIPAVLGATAVEARHIGDLTALDPAPVAVGFAISLLSGLGAIALLRWLLDRRRLWVFAPYLVVVGAASILTG